MKRSRVAMLVGAAAAVFVGLEAVPFYTDWLWFQEVGYGPVFLKIAALRGGLLLAVGLVSFAFLVGNLRAAARARPPDVFWELEEPLGLPSRVVLEPLLQRLLTPTTVALALLLGFSASSEWQTLLTYQTAQPFGVVDPLFGRDVAFYVFQLPLWQRGLRWVFGVVLLTLLVTALIYFLGRVLVLTARGPVITARARAHLLVLLALLLFDRDLAEGYRLEGCPCGGSLHRAAYVRKPRGVPWGLPEGFCIRESFCCSREGCRRRLTPPSLRFLGRRVYLGAVVVVADPAPSPVVVVVVALSSGWMTSDPVRSCSTGRKRSSAV